jgi:hypothetical protein
LLVLCFLIVLWYCHGLIACPSTGLPEEGWLLNPSASGSFILRFFILIIIGLFIFNPLPASAADVGLLKVRNQFAPHLMFLTPVPIGPDPLPQGRWQIDLSLDYSSVFFAEHSERWSVLVDMEMAVVDLGLRYGLTPRLTLSLNQPAARMSAGFLDGPLEDYHSAFGFPNYDKDTRPEDDFAYFIRKDGRDWFRADPGSWHLMDTTLGAELSLLSEPRMDLSFVYQIQLPTGESDSGFGNDALDHSLMIAFCRSHHSLRFFLTTGFHLPGQPSDTDADIRTRPFGSLLVGTAYTYNAELSFVAQVNGYTSPIEETGIAKLDNGSLELGLGVQRQLGRGMELELAFTEDLTRAAPDFNLHLCLSLRK